MMFRQLKNRFLLLNLVIISLTMLAAFVTIYAITYRDVQHDIGMELRKMADAYRHDIDGPPRGGRGIGQQLPFPGGPMDGAPMQDMPAGDDPMAKGGPESRSVSFMLQTDSEGNLTARESRFEMDDEFFALALDEVQASGKDSGQFSLGGTDWAYSSQPASAGGQLFVFLDVTARQGILTKLIYTFSAVALVMLIIIYFISRFFANRAIAPVKEAFEKQKQFIADASHELKTPLAVIRTNTDVLLANRDETVGSQAKWLGYIKQETERMNKLTSDLLYLTEMEGARSSMLFAKFDLSEAVETIILTMEAVIYEKQLQLSYEIEPELIVTGNREQIKQVVIILLDNAVKYANAKGSVTISLKKQHQDAVLSVANTGDGIAPEHLSRIFDRFYRTDASRSRKQGGYGLGLAIAKSIVEQHKGKLYARSAVGESAVFDMHLAHTP